MRSRRTFLVALSAALGATLVPGVALATRRDKVRAAESGPIGIVFELGLDHAPYPTKDGAYTDDTVLVFVPSHYRLPKSRAVDVVVHFHGHNTTAKAAMAAHKLAEQLAESRQNAILVVPQGPVNAPDGDFGKLMRKGGLRAMLDEVREVLADGRRGEALADAGLGDAERTGRILLSAHSGGYRATAATLRNAPKDVREVFLFDALYDEVETFRDWVVADPKHRKLVAYYVGGKPRELSLELASELEGKGVGVLREKNGARLTRAELTRGRAVFLEGHATHGTAPYEEHALRDCLFASCLRGRGSGKWLADKDLPRSS
jgi:hypothetical protein